MKVVIVTPYFPPHIGGVEHYVYNIAVRLQQTYKWDVVIVTSHAGKTIQIEEKNGLKIYRLPYLFNVSNTPIHPLWFVWIKHILKKERPDLVSAHTPVPFMADITARVCGTTPFVLHYHNDIAKDSFLQRSIYTLFYIFFASYTLKKATKISVLSDFYASISTKLAPYSKKIVAIPPGVDMKLHNLQVKPLPSIAATNPTVLFVARLHKTHSHKGLNYLLKAIALVKKSVPSIHLYVLGEGDNKKQYESKARQLDILQQVTFTGYVSDEKLARYYASCTVFVLPSYNISEGFGMVLIEANAHGKPVIGTNIGGIPFAIRDKKSGLLVPPRDSESLAKAICELVQNKDKAKQMGMYGYQMVQKEFSWDIQTKKTNDLYTSLL